MPRMAKKRMQELNFFLNDLGRVNHNVLCRRCVRSCKQSFRTVVVECSRYLSKRAVEVKQNE